MTGETNDSAALRRKRVGQVLEKFGIGLDDVDSDTPLRLDVAAALAYPDGSMDGRGLRRALQKYKIPIERVARKDYTTLADIQRMRAVSRREKQISASASSGPPLSQSTLNLLFEAQRRTDERLRKAEEKRFETRAANREIEELVAHRRRTEEDRVRQAKEKRRKR